MPIREPMIGPRSVVLANELLPRATAGFKNPGAPMRPAILAPRISEPPITTPFTPSVSFPRTTAAIPKVKNAVPIISPTKTGVYSILGPSQLKSARSEPSINIKPNASKAPMHWEIMYFIASDRLIFLIESNPSVTAGFIWHPEICPIEYTNSPSVRPARTGVIIGKLLLVSDRSTTSVKENVPTSSASNFFETISSIIEYYQPVSTMTLVTSTIEI